jgi:WD40 repeat protein
LCLSEMLLECTDNVVLFWQLAFKKSGVLSSGRVGTDPSPSVNVSRPLLAIKSANVQSMKTNSILAATLSGHDRRVNALVVLTNGMLASGGEDRTIRLWEVSTQQTKRILEGHKREITALAALPDDNLASGSRDCTIRIWDVFSNCSKATLEGHDMEVTSLSCLPNGKLASGSWDGLICIWDISTKRCEFSLQNNNTVSCVVAPPTSKIIGFCGDYKIRVWNTITQKCEIIFQGHPSYASTVIFLSNNRIAVGHEDGVICVWSISPLQCEATIQGHTRSIHSLSLLANGKLVSASEDDTIRLWNIQAQICELVLPGHSTTIITIPGVYLLACGCQGGAIRIRKIYHQEQSFELSEICSSSLLNDYSKVVSPVPAGRSWMKLIVSIWYNVIQTATFLHSLRERYKQRSVLSNILRVNIPSEADIEQCFVTLALIRHVDFCASEYSLLRDRLGSIFEPHNWELFDGIFLENRFCTVENIFGQLDSRSTATGWIRIVGKAGTGKTSLMHYLTYRWSRKDSFWDNRFDAVFLVKLNLLTQERFFESGVTVEAVADLAALILDSLDRPDSLSLDTIIYFLRKKPTVILLLLDGFDEVANLYIINNRIHSVLDFTLSLPNGILTSRPVTFPVSWVKIFMFRIGYEILGFSEPNVVNYIRHHFGENRKQAAAALLATIQMNPDLLRLAQVPVNLHTVCTYWCDEKFADDGGHGMGSVTSWYGRVVLSALRQMQLKRRAPKFELTNEYLRHHYRFELRELSRLAYQAFEVDQTQILCQTLMRQFFENNYSLLQLFREEWGFLREAEVYVKLVSSEDIGAHYFTHLTYQEYFCALYFVEALVPLPNESRTDKMNRLQLIQQLAQTIRNRRLQAKYASIWRFVAGLLGRSPYVEYRDYYWDALLPESDDVVGCHDNQSIHAVSNTLGVHNSTSVISMCSTLICEAILVSKESSEPLPTRLIPVESRFEAVLQWHLLCEDRGLVALGDQMSSTNYAINDKLNQHEARRQQLVHDLQSLNSPPIASSPFNALMGYSDVDANSDIGENSPNLALLRSPSASSRLLCARQLCQRFCAESIKLLRQLFETDPDDSVRAVAFAALYLQLNAAMNDKYVDYREQIQLIEIAGRDQSDKVRRGAAMVSGAKCLIAPFSLDRLRQVFQNDASSSVRLICAKVLTMLRDHDHEAYVAVIAALDDEKREVRLEALSFLKETVARLSDASVARSLCIALIKDHFTLEEQADRAIILRRIQPRMYERIDSSMFSVSCIAAGYVESLWFHVHNSFCCCPELRAAEKQFLDSIGRTGKLAQLIRVLRQPLALPLITSVFEDSFSDDSGNIAQIECLDEMCLGSSHFPASIAKFNNCCSTVDETIALQCALFGPGDCLVNMSTQNISADDLRKAFLDSRTELNNMNSSGCGLPSMDQDHLAAFRLYTRREPAVYKLLNYPFYNRNLCMDDSIRNQRPFMAYLLRSFESLLSNASLVYKGPAFRTMHVPEYLGNSWRNEFQVGKKVIFPSFTDVSLSEPTIEDSAVVAGDERIFYKFMQVTGLRCCSICSEPGLDVLLKPPAVFIVRGADTRTNGILKVLLERDISVEVTYL